MAQDSILVLIIGLMHKQNNEMAPAMIFTGEITKGEMMKAISTIN